MAARDRNGIILLYEVVAEPQITFGGSLMQATVNVTDMTTLLGNLHPYVNYTISVRAYTSFGPGPFGTVIEATLEDSKLPL